MNWLQQCAPAVVEIVGVVVVGEQHDVDRGQVGHLDRRTDGLHRRGSEGEVVALPRLVEGRIGEDLPSVDLDEHGRPADMGDSDAHDGC